MHRQPTTRYAILAAAIVTGAVLSTAGCSSDEQATSGPACDDASIQQAIEESLMGAEASLVGLEGVECTDEWAVAFPTISDFTDDVAITATSVLRAQGNVWVVVDDRREVCGTYDPAGDPENPAYPSDAQVPEEIWFPACNTN